MPHWQLLWLTLAQVDGASYVLEILDTASSETFTAMRDLYIRDGNAFLLIYSVVSTSTFAELEDLYETVVRIKGPDCFALGKRYRRDVLAWLSPR